MGRGQFVIDAAGHPIAGEVDADQSQEPLVLLAGQGNSRRWWYRSASALGAHRPLLLLDYPGTGASPTPSSYDWSTRQLASDLLLVLDALGVSTFSVYGTSMGGRVAQWMAALAPERVSALILGCTMLGGSRSVRPEPQVWQALAGADPQVLTDLMYSPAWQAAHPGPYNVLGDTTSTAARRGHRRASDRHDITAHVDRIAAPTLVLHGRDDQLAPPENAELIAAAISSTKDVIYLDARHAYFDECQAQATDAVRRFLTLPG